MQKIDTLKILRESGEFDPDLEPVLSNEDLLKMYRFLLLTRQVNIKGLSLQRQGRVGFFIDSTGQEACQIGATYALMPDDWIFPAYREPGVPLLRGVPLRLLFDQLLGNAEDTSKGRQMPIHWSYKQVNVVSSSSPIAAQISHAVGLAYAARYKKDKIVSLTFFGDGATSQGEFHSALNFAGVFKLPVVFFCQNNQYAISLPVSRQTASASLAIKALSYGFEGIQVDGNDILAVYKATKDAATKARLGDGPTLIEAVTYRVGSHSSSDDARRYRSDAEVEMWKMRDPITRFKVYLAKKGVLSEEEEKRMQQEVEAEVGVATKEGEAIPPPPLESLFEDVYSEKPWYLVEEMNDLLEEE